MAKDEEEFIKLIRPLFRRRGKSQAALARHLKLHPSQVTKLLQGRRTLAVNEKAKIIDFFHEELAPSGLRSVGQLGGVIVIGRLGDHIWEVDDKTVRPADRRVGSPAIDYPIDEQSAYELAASSRDGDFKDRDFVYTVPFENYRTRPMPDDIVVVRRRQSGLTSFSLQRAVPSGNGTVLKPVLEGSDKVAAAKGTDQIVGLVIGTYRPRIRRL